MSNSKHITSELCQSILKSFYLHRLGDLYAYDGNGPIPRQVTDPGVRKIGDFPIVIPNLPGVRPGDRVDIQIDIIFAHTEIRIEVLVKGQLMTFTSKFDAEVE